jgi:hypothetical protein
MIQLFLAYALASTTQFIEMNLDVTVKGKKLNPIRTLAEAGKKQTMTQKIDKDIITIELIPQVENGDELHLAFKVIENKKTISSPQVITFDEQEASIEIGDEGASQVQLSVRPKIL